MYKEEDINLDDLSKKLYSNNLENLNYVTFPDMTLIDVFESLLYLFVNGLKFYQHDDKELTLENITYDDIENIKKRTKLMKNYVILLPD